MELTIALAGPDELQDVLSILDEAGAWLPSIGITQQWPSSFSQDEGTAEFYSAQLRAGTIYLARSDGFAVGTFRLLEEDPRVWPEASPGEALYLHSFAVRRSVAGTGVADALLAWARDFAASRGCLELRLECWAGNNRLRRYYLDAGFEFRGECAIERFTGSSFQAARFSRPTS